MADTVKLRDVLEALMDLVSQYSRSAPYDYTQPHPKLPRIVADGSAALENARDLLLGLGLADQVEDAVCLRRDRLKQEEECCGS